MAGSYNTVINLYIGENQFVNCTENMVSIDNNRIASNVSASTVIELYDDTALVIDSILASSSNREIEFEYGYVNGAMSDRYSGTITRYQTQFTGHSAICTIECVSTGVATQELGDNSNKSKSYSGTISDIVYQVASEESWEVGKIEATEYKVFTVTRADESALKFVESLRSKAISAETGKGDLKVRLEDKDSKSIIYFATEITVEETEEDAGDFNVYDYQYVLGMPNENIISFKPQYEQVLSSLVGATALVTSSMDPETNEITEIQVAGERTKEEREKNIEIEPEEDEAIKIVKRYVGGNSYSAEDLTTMAKNLYDIASSLSYKATLVLKGKPRINPNTKISILVLTREGQRHHSSGNYCIATVDDLVENGTYTTTLELLKNAESVTVTVNQTSDNSSVYTGSYNVNYSGTGTATGGVGVSGDLSEKVKKYLGTPYVWGGDSWEEGGFDCSGFAWHFLKYECGSTTIGGRDTAAGLSNRGVSVPYDSSYSQMQPGDLCFKGNPASHVVVYMGGGKVVHSPQTGDVIKWADLWFTPSKVKRYL